MKPERHNYIPEGGVLPPPINGWIVEKLGSAIFLVVVTQIIRGWQRRGYPSVHALVCLSAVSMFWQEFYADWGAYLYYNDAFWQMPWGSTLWTTPNKPWYTVTAYGWFYSAVLPGTVTFFKWVRTKKPEWSYNFTMITTVLIPFYLWNLLSADLTALYTFYFHYLKIIGPGLTTSRGTVPLMYPAFPFCTFGPFVVWSLDNRDSQGRTWFERWFGSAARPLDTAGQIKQVVAWCLGMNIMYLCCLTVPLVTIRSLFLPSSTVIP